MAASTAEKPEQEVRQWLLESWNGALRPLDVRLEHEEDSLERESWYFYLVLPAPSGETWNDEEYADLQLAIREKAFQVGLTWPWYVIPSADGDEQEVAADDVDPPEPE